MYRFLLRPRWIVGHVLLLVTVVAFVNLGLWQLRRLDERRTNNALIAARADVPVQPLDAAVAAAAGDLAALEFRRVEVTGSYDPDAQVLTAPRAIPGGPGLQVLTVLERDRGPDVLVDRGWIPFSRDVSRPPPAPAGSVIIDGVVRVREAGEVGRAAQVAQIVPDQIAARLGRALAPYYVQMQAQQPAPGPAEPRPTPLPERGEGNHLSYAVQWFSFATIALIGYPLLVRWAARQTDRSDRSGPSGRPVAEPDPSVV